MQLTADEVFAERKENDYAFTFGFRDHTADYVLFLSRFSDLEPDEGQIEVVVRDQVCSKSATMKVQLDRRHCRVAFDEPTATRQLGISEYIVSFHVDQQTYEQMIEVLRVIFEGLPGLMIEDHENLGER